RLPSDGERESLHAAWPNREFPLSPSDGERAGVRGCMVGVPRCARFRFGVFFRLVAEKLPFMVLAAASSIITFLVQKRGGALLASEGLDFPARLANAVVAYATYLQKAIWPRGLAMFYPHPAAWPAW